MAAPKITDADFIRLFDELGPRKLADKIGSAAQGVFKRRRNLEKKHGIVLSGPQPNEKFQRRAYPHRIEIDVGSGAVLIGSDGHYWPGDASTAHRGFVKFARDLKPRVLVYNGDAFDGASVSRHPPIGWAGSPTVQQEIEACQERLGEIEHAVPRGCRRIWSLGNHDSRFETRIATVAPEFAKVAGTALQDHFPQWEPCWSVWINDVVVKHRFKGGIHAAHTNAMWAGKTIVTGHLHSAKISPFSDYHGTRYGVDTGCLADINGSQFVDYTEDNPKNWRSGFCVLTFEGGRVLQPELVTVWDEHHVQFRGKLVRV